jgi:hypothetical protein
VHEFAVEIPESVNAGPLLVVEQAARADEHVAGVLHNTSIWLFDVDVPLSLVFVPAAMCNLMLELCESLYAVLLRGRLQVFANLFCGCVQR